MVRLGFLFLLINLVPLKAPTKCLTSIKVGSVVCKSKKKHHDHDSSSSMVRSMHITYRAITRGQEVRRCRLEPTCSSFTLKAIKKEGFLIGFLKGFARSQMEHSSQGGFLEHEIGSDGSVVYKDEIDLWEN